MSDISWNSVGTALIMFLMTFPFLLFLASHALTHRVIATQASPEIIRRFLESLPMPVRFFFAGLSQHHLESATQNYANMRSTKYGWLLGEIMFSLLPWLLIMAFIIASTKQENPTERAIYAALGISECIFWLYAIRFGRKLDKIAARDSEA